MTGYTIDHVNAAFEVGGLQTLGARIGQTLEEMEKRGIDVQQVVIRVGIEPYDEHDDCWVAELRWPNEAEPDVIEEPWPFDDEPEDQS